MGVGVVGLAENKATQPSLAGAWAELGNFLGNLESFFSNLERKLTQQRWSKFFLRLGQLCLANLVGPIS